MAGCADLASDPRNCGGCDVLCTGSDTCVEGRCQAPSCEASAATAPRTLVATLHPPVDGPVFTITAVADPCARRVHGTCESQTTLLCTGDGAEIGCVPSLEGWIISTIDGVLGTGVFCAAEGVPCAGGCSVTFSDGSRVDYACADCGVAPECVDELAAGCICYGRGSCSNMP